VQIKSAWQQRLVPGLRHSTAHNILYQFWNYAADVCLANRHHQGEPLVTPRKLYVPTTNPYANALNHPQSIDLIQSAHLQFTTLQYVYAKDEGLGFERYIEPCFGRLNIM
jgi:hypothetical protein